MKKTNEMKRNRGITLIALVVTIVVLIILATVSINIVFSEDGIIQQAQKAVEFQANAEASDQDAMNQLLQEYENILNPPWSYSKETQTVTNGKITLNIGDYVNYDCTTGEGEYKSEVAKNGYADQTFKASEYTYGWRVLGVDEQGQLLLIAEDFVPKTGATGRSYFYLGKSGDATLGQAGYVNGANELNNICAIYGQGKGAVGARSVTVKDINTITGYDPETALYNNGTTNVNQYGNKVTYTLNADDGKVYYQGTKQPTTSTSSTYTSFTYYTGEEWKALAAGESAEITSNYYYYYPNTLTTSSSGTTVGIDTTSTAYKMLFTNSSTGSYSSSSGTTSNYYYWLADPHVGTYIGVAGFGMRYVHSGYVNGTYLYYSYGITGDWNYGVRPVVTLKSDISLENSGETYDGCDLYNIK